MDIQYTFWDMEVSYSQASRGRMFTAMVETGSHLLASSLQADTNSVWLRVAVPNGKEESFAALAHTELLVPEKPYLPSPVISG